MLPCRRKSGLDHVLHALQFRPMDASAATLFLEANPAFLEHFVLQNVSKKRLQHWIELKEDPFCNGHDKDEQLEPHQGINEDLRQHEMRQHEMRQSEMRQLSSTRRSFIHVRPCVTESKSKRPRSKSLFSTPLRKLSAARFEASGLRTPILALNTQGQPTFIRSDFLNINNNIVRSAKSSLGSSDNSWCRSSEPNVVGHIRKSGLMRGHSRVESDAETILLRILQDAMLEKELSACVISLLEGMKQLFKADHASLVWSNEQSQQPLCGTYFGLSRGNAFSQNRLPQDVPEASVLASASALQHTVRVSFNCVGQEEHEHFQQAMAAPMLNEDNSLHGALFLARTVNEENSENRFDEHMEQRLGMVARVATIMLLKCAQMEEMRLELARSEVFLELAHVVFAEQSRLEPAIKNILSNFLLMIECDRAQILLVDENNCDNMFSRVFDLQRSDLFSVCEENHEEGRQAVLTVIACHVAQNNEIVNIEDLSSQSKFELDSNKHISLLCMPIRDASRCGKVLGVITLLDKDDGFSRNDERFVEAFALFCGMAIRNAADFEAAVVSEAKLQVAMEVMSYQASVSDTDAVKMARAKSVSSSSMRLEKFDFDYRKCDDTLKAALAMFEDLGLISHFRVDKLTFCRWLMSVKKNYRNDTVPYHNWWHAFSVAQLMFSVLKRTQWHTQFGPVDTLGLMIACLCHDLDHRGTTNTFQAKAGMPLAKLYSSSTLERHHLNQCLLLLSIAGNRILDNLEQSEFSATVSVIERCILATDLAEHFRQQEAIHALASSRSPTSSPLLQSLLMTASDLGASTKPWPVHLHVSRLIAEEFWTQGDLERDAFDTKQLAPMLDRSVSLAQVQIDFLDNVCLPVYNDLALLNGDLKPLLEQCKSNSSDWSRGRHKEERKDLAAISEQ